MQEVYTEKFDTVACPPTALPYLHNDEDYRNLLTKEGFIKIQIYGDYDRNLCNKESRRLIVAAQ